MPLKNYTTSVAVEKTVSEITGILVTHKARSIQLDYDADGMIEAISFWIETPRGDMSFRLPTNVEAVERVLKKQAGLGQVPRSQTTPAQARRVAWRIIKDWLDAQMAILETEMVKFEQIFLPYAVMRDGQYLFDHIMSGRLLTEGKEE